MNANSSEGELRAKDGYYLETKVTNKQEWPPPQKRVVFCRFIYLAAAFHIVADFGLIYRHFCGITVAPYTVVKLSLDL